MQTNTMPAKSAPADRAVWRRSELEVLSAGQTAISNDVLIDGYGAS